MIVETDKHGVAFEIDDEDYESVSNFMWSINRGYPATNIRLWIKSGEVWCRQWIAMELHEFLLGRAPAGLEWDHKDRNRLNNRRDNLQAVTRAQNMKNKSLYSNSVSGRKGISSISSGWSVELTQTMTVSGKRLYVGQYSTLEEAIAAQDAARRFHG